MNNIQRSQHARWAEYANEQGGTLVSGEYVNRTEPLIWQCQAGHIFKRPAKHMGGRWCPQCRATGAHSIEEARRIAGSLNGCCLSTSAGNRQMKLVWRCENNHTFSATIAKVRAGRWCPSCESTNGRVKHSIETMRAIAERYDGECLSDEYPPSSVPLTWRCKNGNTFQALAKKVATGSWCPCTKCAGNEPLGLSKMQRIAGQYDGECLSDVSSHDLWTPD